MVLVSKRAGERDPVLRSRVRAMLPGDEWREYVNAGAERAYDGPLVPQREEARKLRRRLRYVKAHKTEPNSYKIRVRGYDRRNLGQDPIEKRLVRSRHEVQLGPFKRSVRSLSVGKPTRGEAVSQVMRGAGGAVPRLLLVGGAGALAADALDGDDKKKDESRTKRRLRAAATAVTGAPVGGKDGSMSKSLVEIRGDVSDVVLEKGFIDRAVNAARGVKQRASGFAQQNQGKYYTISDEGDFALTDAGRSVRNRAVVGATALGGAAAAAKPLASMVLSPLKARAKKAAMYGAVGLGGTAAAGSYLGASAGS